MQEILLFKQFFFQLQIFFNFSCPVDSIAVVPASSDGIVIIVYLTILDESNYTECRRMTVAMETYKKKKQTKMYAH